MEIWGTGWQAKYILFLWTIRKIIIIQQILCILPLCAIFHPKGSQRDLSLIPFFSFQKITCQPLTILFHTVQYILKFPTSLFILMKLSMYICLGLFFQLLEIPCSLDKQASLLKYKPNFAHKSYLPSSLQTFCKPFTRILEMIGQFLFCNKRPDKILFWKDLHGN